MRVALDIEANGLENPTKVWLVVLKDLDTGQLYVVRRPSDDRQELQRLQELLARATLVVGHNVLEYDLVVLGDLFHIHIPVERVLDTLVISRLVDYSREMGHSIESYGEEFGYPKIKFSDFSKYSEEMCEYCIRDVEICERVYHKYSGIITNSGWQPAIRLEHDFQLIVNNLHRNGFAFDVPRANKLLTKVEIELKELDEKILNEFPPQEVLIREFTPKGTKYGTISKTSVPRSLWDQIQEFEVGKTYRQTKMVPFNPSSPKQVVKVLHDAGWKPVDKTKTHIEVERELQRAQYARSTVNQVDLEALRARLGVLKSTGWKINENNLNTLPPSAPAPAKTLAKRILLESRRRTLTEWMALVNPVDLRIHGKFVGIGAWTQRMAHQNPNTANIPTEAKLFGKEMRSLWRAPKNRLLVGVDAEGIQLRIFAHYIDDPEFTRSLVEGKKDDKTDPHSLNARILGSVCNGRQTAKRFIYALLLGAGIGKLAEILGCEISEARDALDRLLVRYTGFAKLKSEVLPKDGKRGYFIGLDGRHVPIPGDTASGRTHLAMSGYLQNGEAIVMKKACLLWHEQLKNEDIKIVNFVHDEWQTEVPNDLTLALKIARVQADSLRIVGEELGLKCPLAGSYWNDDHKDFTVGSNWYQTH